MEPVVSIVVPVYNVERYLDACVQSLLDQELEAIEVILVDDGSTDGSSALCDRWAERDARIKVIHKANGGLSDARNIGVDAATAPYIGFVDSDDHVSPAMYRVLYENLVKEGADLSLCGMYNCYANRTIVPDRQDYLVLSDREAVELCLVGDLISVTAVNRLYPRELAREVRFPVGKTTEDGFTVIEFLSRVRTIVVDLRPQYYYEHREGTISTRPYGPGSCDVIEAYERNRALVEKRYPELLAVADFRCFWSRFVVLDSMLSPGASDDAAKRAEIVSYLRSHCGDILRNPYVGTARKVALLGLMLNVRVYGLFQAMQRRRVGYQSGS